MMRLKVSLFVRDFFTHVFNITSNYLFVSDWSRKLLFTITLENMKSWKLLKLQISGSLDHGFWDNINNIGASDGYMFRLNHWLAKF